MTEQSGNNSEQPKVDVKAKAEDVLRKSKEAFKNFDKDFFLQRVKLVLKDPKGCWNIIKAEAMPVEDVLKKFFGPLLLLAVVAQFLGSVVFGLDTLIGRVRTPFFSSLFFALVQFVMGLVYVYLAAFIFNKIAPKFEGNGSTEDSLRLIAFSATAGYLAQLGMVAPGVITILLAVIGGFYSLYTLYHGITPMLNVPESRKIGFLVVSVIAIGVVYVVLSAVFIGLFKPSPPAGVNYTEMKELQDNLRALMHQ